MSLSVLRQTFSSVFVRANVRAVSTTASLLKDASAAKTTRSRSPRTKAKKDDGKTAKEKKPKLDEADHPPKKAPSAYTLFFQEYFAEHRNEFMQPDGGKLQVSELARAVGNAWSELQDSEPAKFEALKAQAKDAQAKHDVEYKKWYFDRTPAQRTQIEKALGRKLLFPGGKNAWKTELRRRPGNPGRPASPFFEFSRSLESEFENHPELDGKTGVEYYTARAKLAAEKWRTLSTEEKARWSDAYRERKAKFDEWFKTQEEYRGSK